MRASAIDTGELGRGSGIYLWAGYLMKEWLPSVRFISFIRQPAHR
jgi:hypothetical protein